jgi:hypothetical protein
VLQLQLLLPLLVLVLALVVERVLKVSLLRSLWRKVK